MTTLIIKLIKLTYYMGIYDDVEPIFHCCISTCPAVTQFFLNRLLSGQKIESKEDAAAVMEWFHGRGVKTVVLSSTDLGTEGELVVLASSITSRCCRDIARGLGAWGT